MDNKNKILAAFGLLAVGYFGKKHMDKKKGSGAIWSLPTNARDPRISDQRAFFAWHERESGMIPWEKEADKTMGKQAFIEQYAGPGSYSSAIHGTTADAEWTNWLAENKENYPYIEKTMRTGIDRRFDGESEGSILSSGQLKGDYRSKTSNFSGKSSSDPFIPESFRGPNLG